MKILLFGGSGLLGAELRKQADMIAPSSSMDIRNAAMISAFIELAEPNIVINAAAILKENDPEIISTNIIGAANVANASNEIGARLVYISTDYIYKGDKGNYKETDEILPFNFYAWTKLGGECSARGVKNHLIIRTSFGAHEFPYKEAFSDKWASKEYVDKIAPLIYEAAISPLTGVLNIGTERKTLYTYAIERNRVKAVKRADSNFLSPYDTSFNLQRWIDYKTDPIARPNTHCRVCGSDKLHKYLDLGMMPLANNLELSVLEAKGQQRFPLQVMVCEDCNLSQLSVVIDPKVLFSNYTYESGINQGYLDHCYQMALDLKKYITPNFHIDIAGNDGSLLKQFLRVNNCEVLNIDPASNLTAISENNGIPALNEFWPVKVKQADLITATNVFAHVDNVNAFISGVKDALTPEGILVLEFPYLADFLERVEFDTIYFEHLSYFSIRPLDKLCKNHDLRIISVTMHQIHGGTARVIIAHNKSSYKTEHKVREYIEKENYTIKKYLQWSNDVNKVITDFREKILDLKSQGFKIAAFAASAKGNTLLNSAGISSEIDFIADETPSKIGKYSPGTGIKIVNKQEILKQKPDYIVILSWNFKEEIIEKLSKIGYTGKYI